MNTSSITTVRRIMTEYDNSVTVVTYDLFDASGELVASNVNESSTNLSRRLSAEGLIEAMIRIAEESGENHIVEIARQAIEEASSQTV